MTPAEASAWLVGQPLGEYEIVAYIDSGAFGHVFRGEHTSTGAPVALKTLDVNAHPEGRLEFENEGDLLAALRSASGVVDHVHTGAALIPLAIPGGTSTVPLEVRYHAVELADGCLERLLAYRRSLSWAEKLHLYRNVVLGLHQMRLAGICHRDLKAANCLLFERKFNDLDAKLNDLGRSRRLAAPPIGLSYSPGRGDPVFAPLEMVWWQGEDTTDCHLAADLYGIGSLLFEIATGQGFTSVVLGPTISWFNQTASIPPLQRKAAYMAAIPDLRGRISSALELLDTDVPTSIRNPMKDLIRLLTEPDPSRRTPIIVKPRRPDPGLLWLLRRVDIMSAVLKSSSGVSRSRAHGKGA